MTEYLTVSEIRRLLMVSVEIMGANIDGDNPEVSESDARAQTAKTWSFFATLADDDPRLVALERCHLTTESFNDIPQDGLMPADGDKMLEYLLQLFR
jgi:hypothetical protein